MTAAALALALVAASAPGAVTVRAPDEVEIGATVHRGRFERWLGMPGYHLIAWKKGSSSAAALFESDASDTEVLDALERLRRPGPTIPMDAWERRRDAASAAPDTVASGPGVEVLVRLPRRDSLLPLSEILTDSAGRGVDLRFSGNRSNIPAWKSGCIACLYSCPGAKVANARYTLRDYSNGATKFRVRDGVLPPDGSRVGIVLRFAHESKP
jgi:hypothetical protein